MKRMVIQSATKMVEHSEKSKAMTMEIRKVTHLDLKLVTMTGSTLVMY